MTRLRLLSICVLSAAVAVAASSAPQASATLTAVTQVALTPAPPKLTLVVGSVLSPPRVVLGADNRQHLAHELQLLNNAPFPVRLARLDTLDAASGVVLQSLRGDALAALVKRPEGGSFRGTLGPGRSALAILDGSLSQSAPTPTALTHRIFLAFPAIPGFDLAKVYRLGPATVRRERPVVIGAPVAGPRWVAVNGCCATLNSHRGGIVPVNGRLVGAERFAIDFVQLNADHRLFSHGRSELSGYAGYGERIVSVAAGTVISTHDGAPDQIPPSLPPFSLATAGGNTVVVDIGGGQFAYYAHLQPHSLAVKRGDHVRRGQLLGRLGNSGNSTAPHLHFHVMDGPSTPVADSVPYEFTAFGSLGTVTDDSAIEQGRRVPIGPRLRGPHRAQLPLDLQVVDFH